MLRHFYSLVDINWLFNFDKSFMENWNLNSALFFNNFLLKDSLLYNFLNYLFNFHHLFNNSGHGHNFLHNFLDFNNLWHLDNLLYNFFNNCRSRYNSIYNFLVWDQSLSLDIDDLRDFNTMIDNSLYLNKSILIHDDWFLNVDIFVDDFLDGFNNRFLDILCDNLDDFMNDRHLHNFLYYFLNFSDFHNRNFLNFLNYLQLFLVDWDLHHALYFHNLGSNLYNWYNFFNYLWNLHNSLLHS